MPSAHKYYKNTDGNSKMAKNRVLRGERLREAQREMRQKKFNTIRNVENCRDSNIEEKIPVTEENTIKPSTSDRLAVNKHVDLMKWKNKNNYKNVNTVPIKPFKVGIVHHQWYSPPSPTKVCKSLKIKTQKQTTKVPQVKRTALDNIQTPAKKLKLYQKEERKKIEKMMTEDKIKNNCNVPCTDLKQNKIKEFENKIEKSNDNSAFHLEKKQIEENIHSSIDNKQKKVYSPKQYTPKTSRLIWKSKTRALRRSTILKTKKSIAESNSKRRSSRDSLAEKLEKTSLENDSPIEETKFAEERLSLPSQSNESNYLESQTNLNLNKSLTMEDKPPAFFSPFIVSSRGKSSERKEIQRRRFSQPVDIPMKDTVLQNMNISVEEEQRTAQYYKFILEKEIERLNERCNTWNKIKNNEATPEEIQYLIQAAVGQTQLLINKKFERFRGLVIDCENGKGEMLVTCKDLQGFWDMMYMEIKDCDNRFNALEELQNRNWVEKEEIKQTQKQERKKRLIGKKTVKNVSLKTSSLKAHIAAARQKKINIKSNEGDLQQNEEINSLLKKDNRRSTPKRRSIADTVCKSQDRRSNSSPLILMKLSKLCKTPDVKLDSSISYINSSQTPAKSILKASKDESVNSIVKSTNKVLFKEQLREFHNFLPDEAYDSDNVLDHSYMFRQRLTENEQNSINLASSIEEGKEITRVKRSETKDSRIINQTQAKRKSKIKFENVRKVINEDLNVLLPKENVDEITDSVTPKLHENTDEAITLSEIDKVLNQRTKTATPNLKNKTINAKKDPKTLVRRKSLRKSKQTQENVEPNQGEITINCK